MRLFSLLAIGAYAASNSIQFDETTPCENFEDIFGKFDGIKTKCHGKSNKKKTKKFCNLVCDNGYDNVWSVRPIKCKARKSGDDVGTYKWKPSKIKYPEELCNPKEKCGQLKGQYNVTNKLLTWEKSNIGRQTFYNFSCAEWTNDNGKVFEMIPWPKDYVTCTCNYNKPQNVRCKWRKVKNSIIRCVRADKPKYQNNNDDQAYEDMYDDGDV